MKELFATNGQFRLFLVYQLASGLGGGIFQLFMLLSVHLIFQNPMYTGIAGFLIAAPFIFSFMVGPVVDRRNKVTIMRLTTLLEFVVLAMLVVVPFQTGIGVFFMFTVILIYNCAALFETPAGTSLLPQIVPPDKIMQANSLINMVSLVGGIGIAIIIMTALGDGLMGGEAADVRVLYGLSAGFLALAFGVALFLRDPAFADKGTSQTDAPAVKHNYLEDLKAGAAFIRRSVLLFFAIGMIARVFVAEIAYINMPAFAEYHVGAQGYIIFSIVGMTGGLAASFFMGKFGPRFKIGMLLLVLSALSGAARIAFALLVPVHYHAGLVVLFLYIALLACMMVAIGTLWQKLPPKDMVGRAGTLNTTAAALFVALGALAGGVVGRLVPVVDYIFIAQGVAIMVIGLAMWLVPAVRKLPKIDEIEAPGTEE